MAYLIDTNIISELRKGERANWGVRQFFAVATSDGLFLPVQVIGEIRAGIAKAAKNNRRDQAKIYTCWLDSLVEDYKERIIDFDRECAQVWGHSCPMRKRTRTLSTSRLPRSRLSLT